ncbi:NADPH-dependent 2,4-dienoyl-CoA reductase/sulfur reductase-like enzyme/nitrite reductase/ring-hydroxylating ferredoxin subunit [Bradyrhizobium sp. LM2.7]
MTWREVISLDELRPDAVKGLDIDGTPVALYRLDEEVFATHGICTHALAFLADGFVEEGKIECPLHQGLFDIRSGKALCAPLTKDVQTFAVKVESGKVFVDLDISAAADVDKPAEELHPDRSSAPSQDPVVVVGAGQAAAAAIRALRRSGFSGPVELVGSERHLPYERPPLSKDILLGKATIESCIRLPVTDIDDLKVTTHLDRRVVGVDVEARTVRFEDGTEFRYAALLLATGGVPRRLDIPGGDLPGVHYLRTIEDATAIGASFSTAKRVVVIGGGFIGMELASVASSLGKSTVVLEREAELLARVLPATLGRTFRTLAENHGVTVHLATSVQAIERTGVGLTVRTSAGDFDADAVCIGVGLVPETALAAAAGCEVDGGVVVDSEQRTNVPGIWAAGDCALHHSPVRGRRGRLESWHNAEEQGAAAGRSIAGLAPEAVAAQQPWFWTDQFGLNIQILGVSAADDRVAVTGRDGESGAVYRTVDPATGGLTSVIAFSDPGAIRQARKDFEKGGSFDAAKVNAVFLEDKVNEEKRPVRADSSTSSKNYIWPAEGLTRVPDWVYTDQYIYEREIEKIFHGRTWNYVALESEVPNTGDFIRSNVGPTPVVVSRAEDGSINVFENRCMHRAAEFCRDLSGNATRNSSAPITSGPTT